MNRHISGLREADRSAGDELPDGLFLVRIEGVQYRWHTQKPYYFIRFVVVEPKHVAGRSLVWSDLLHSARDVEVKLVSARFWL